MMTHDELVLCIKQQYPHAKHCVDFFVGMPIDGATGAQTAQARVLQWSLEGLPPSEDDINRLEQTHAQLIADHRATQARLARSPNISARQLWLMARQIGVTKGSILSALADLPDQDEAETLHIELTEPPMNGYERFSTAVEKLRIMQDIPEEQFDTLWLWASEL